MEAIEKNVSDVRSQPLVASVVALPFAPHQVVSYNRALQVFVWRVRRHDRRRQRWMVQWRYCHHARVAGHAGRGHLFGRSHLQSDTAVQRDLYGAATHLARVQLRTDNGSRHERRRVGDICRGRIVWVDRSTGVGVVVVLSVGVVVSGGGWLRSEGLWLERVLCMIYYGMIISGGDGGGSGDEGYLFIKVPSLLFRITWLLFVFFDARHSFS